MLLESVKAEEFRNLGGRIDCGGTLNIISGNNGHGKTNWLEAIYLLATAKSFRTSALSEAVKFGASVAVVRGEVRQGEGIVRRLGVILEGSTKSLTINDKKETLQNFLGQLHAVVFNSDQLNSIRGAPEYRRKFLDGGIVSIFPPYVRTIADYGRVIRQKNSLLRTAKRNDYPIEKVAELLEPWNSQLIGLSAKIFKARLRYVDRLREALEKRLFGQEEVTIRYASALEGKGDLSDYGGLLEERLKLRTAAELYAGHSLIGPHRDDLEIGFDGRDLRRFGSSGQQRSALLILLIAGLAVYREQQGEYPLFLLDDIDAELDYQRIGKLLEYLQGKTQTFVTTSKENFVDRFCAGAGVIHVENGRARAKAA